MNIISAEDLKNLLDSQEEVIVINVLNPDAFVKCRIKGSINIPIHDRKSFEEEAQNLDLDKKIIVYCANYACQASNNAYRALQALGIFDESNLFAYEGGIEEWMEKDFPREGSIC